MKGDASHQFHAAAKVEVVKKLLWMKYGT